MNPASIQVRRKNKHPTFAWFLSWFVSASWNILNVIWSSDIKSYHHPVKDPWNIIHKRLQIGSYQPWKDFPGFPCHCSQQPLELHRLQRGGNPSGQFTIRVDWQSTSRSLHPVLEKGFFLEDSPKTVTSTFTIHYQSIIHHPSSSSSSSVHHCQYHYIDPVASLMHLIRSTPNQTYPPATSTPPWLEGILGTASAVKICSNISPVCMLIHPNSINIALKPWSLWSW